MAKAKEPSSSYAKAKKVIETCLENTRPILSVPEACNRVGISRSTFYFQVRKSPDLQELYYKVLPAVRGEDLLAEAEAKQQKFYEQLKATPPSCWGALAAIVRADLDFTRYKWAHVLDRMKASGTDESGDLEIAIKYEGIDGRDLG